jgi:small subunit ribosomal protein S17
MRLMKGIQIVKRKQLNLMPFQLAVGQVTQLIDTNTREVKVIKMELDEYLKMYFNKYFTLKSIDTNSNSKKGDIVLVRKLERPPAKDKEFGVETVLFRVDEIVDPITGKKVSHDEEALQ